MKRRSFILGAAAATAGAGAHLAIGGKASAQSSASKYFRGASLDGEHNYRNTNFKEIDQRWHRQMVKYFSDEPEGTVVIDTRHHYMYWIWENNTAIRYGVGVGREGFQWFGRAHVARKARWPRWVPPEEMKKRQPNLPDSMDGGPNNPLGARALYLHKSNGSDTGYRLHGTAEPWSIGSDVSSGCIRMFNEDIIDLYRRVPVGTSVLVLEHISDRA
jgi:lipoprotein-anchoring transpeptidase ErfK/SrfK